MQNYSKNVNRRINRRSDIQRNKEGVDEHFIYAEK